MLDFRLRHHTRLALACQTQSASPPGFRGNATPLTIATMAISATKLRADIYRVIEGVIDSGVPVEIELRGKKVRIVPAEQRDKLA